MARQSPDRPTTTDTQARDTIGDAEMAANLVTVASYEGYARTYAERTEPEDADGSEALHRFVAALAPQADVLEIGSGPGWDADYLESRGLRVRRTDATAAFCALQAERGKRADVLDLLVDPLGGPYDGALAMYVLQHVARAQTRRVLGRIADALHPGGAFLVSLQEGDSEAWEPSDLSDGYQVVRRSEAEFDADLDAVGFDIVWRHRFTGRDGDWLIRLARKSA